MIEIDRKKFERTNVKRTPYHGGVSATNATGKHHPFFHSHNSKRETIVNELTIRTRSISSLLTQQAIKSSSWPSH
jgi:hypothetical protein